MKVRYIPWILVLVVGLAGLPLQATHAGGILYAKPTAAGTGDCSSWDNACTLQTALNESGSGDEIWAAAGTYMPTTGTDRTATFQLVGGVSVYGGFDGTEVSRGDRDSDANVTVLSGDLLGNDNTNVAYDEPTRADNSYHVATGADDATLDGFTITAGNASDDTTDHNGGGMYNESSSLTLVHVTFSGNSASYYGAGMYNDSSSPTLMDVTFSGNSADAYGGGMFNNSSSPALSDVTFSGNSTATYDGGGLCNHNGSSPTLTNVTFSGNSAAEFGGGMYNGTASNPILKNVTFSGNSTTGYGGGMFNNSSNPEVTNVTFSDNSAVIGGGMYNYSSSPLIRDTVLWGNEAPDGAQIYDNGSTPVVNDSVVQDGYSGGTNIITDDPLLGALGDYGGYTQTLPLQTGSSAIDTGNDGTCAATDQRGVTRPQGVHCDIGAFELDTTPPTIVSILRAGANPTNAASVDFAVVFSESVLGVDVNDFSLTTSGVSGAAVTGVSGFGSVYTVTVNTGSDDGTIRLDLSPGATVTDLAVNSLVDLPYTSGETYTVSKSLKVFLPLVVR